MAAETSSMVRAIAMKTGGPLVRKKIVKERDGGAGQRKRGGPQMHQAEDAADDRDQPR